MTLYVQVMEPGEVHNLKIQNAAVEVLARDPWNIYY